MKKRILFFVNDLYGGGAEKVLQVLLSHLDYSKYAVTLYSLHQNQLNASYPANLEFRYIFPKNVSNTWCSRFWVKCCNKLKLLVYYHFSPTLFYKLFVRGVYDTEVAFIEGYATRIISGSTNPRSQKLAWVHIDLVNNHWTTESYLNDLEESNVYKCFDRVVCVSEFVKDQVNALFPNLNKVEVCRNPIDDYAIRKMSNGVLTNPRFLNKGVRIISVGRLVQQKGYDRLLRIINRVICDGYDISVNIIGEGIERSSLEDYITENNLDSKVHLLGFEGNPYPYIASSDLFICSSRAEGYSTAVSEAIVIGIPVITTDCSGMREILEDGKYGLITSNDEDSLYEGLRFLLDDKERLNIYKKLSQKRSGYFSIDTLMSKIQELL